MSQLLITLLSGGGAATVSGTGAIIGAAYRHDKAGGQAEVTLEDLQRVQAQSGRTLQEIGVRLTQLEYGINRPPGAGGGHCGR
jgi:hypothetical protein